MDLRQRLATNLRRIRHEKGFSQEALAREAGVDRAHVSKVERGVTYVGIEITGSSWMSWGSNPLSSPASAQTQPQALDSCVGGNPRCKGFSDPDDSRNRIV